METVMATRIGDEELEIEVTLEHTHNAAWLIIDEMSGKKVWLPFSQGRIVSEVDPDGHMIFAVREWWARHNGLI
jgi:hypothetical protein